MMQSKLNRLLGAHVVVAFLHISLAATSPVDSIPTAVVPIKHIITHRAQDDIPLITQAASWPSNHSPAFRNADGQAQVFELPVVSEVFKMVEGIVTPLAPQTSTQAVDATGPLHIIGPGIVVVPTPAPIADPSATLIPDGSSSPGAHPNPVPMRKLIIIASVMGGIVAFTFLTYVLIYRRSLTTCWKKKKAERVSWITFRFSPDEEKGSKEKDLPIPPWLLFSSSFSSHGSTVTPKTPDIQSTARAHSKVIDIASGSPRSKFSVTSSDYPYSPPSSNPSFSSALSTMAKGPVVPPPLLPAAEFFCLPSATDLQNPRHSRIRSAPVFGHVLPTPSQSLATIRSGEHRRSKSVSGLVYIVEPVMCEYPDRKDSGSEWTGSPPSEVEEILLIS